MSRRNAVRVGLIAATLLVLSLTFIAQGHIGFPSRPEVTHAEYEDVTSIEQLFRVGRKVQQPLSVSNSDSAWIDLEHNIPWTTHDGGIEGYTVWSNLYLNGGTLIAAKETKAEADALPNPRAIMSKFEPPHGHPAADESLWSTVVGKDLVHVEFGKRVTRLPGITYIFNDPAGSAGYMVHHHHFIHELLPAAARAVANARDKAGLPMDKSVLPSRIIFPRCGHEPSWRDDKHMNSWVLRTMLPDATIEDQLTWNDRAVGDQVYMFDQVVIVDRWAAHSAEGDVLSLGRMNANVPHMSAPKHFWDPFHDSMQRAIGDIMPHVGKHNLPIVVYIERENNPQVAPDSSRALIEGLKKLTHRAEVHVTRFNALTRRQKAALISRANVVIGLHSDDLLNVAWMSAGQGNGVIELFEEGGYMLDYHLLAGILGLKHAAVQRDHVVTQDMRTNHQLGLRGPGKDGEVEIDAGVVLAEVEKLLDDLDAGRADRDRQVYGSKE